MTKMRRMLVINKPGLTINIKGIPVIRTPTKIDISSVDINIVVMELKKYGLDHYQIIMEEVKEKESKKTSKKEEKDKESLDLSSIYERFDKIDQLLELIVKKPSEIKTIIQTSEGPNSPVVEDLGEEEFIPTINVEDVEIGRSSVRTTTIDNDVTDGVDLLRNIGKKPGG